MKKTSVKVLVDILLYVSMCLLAGTGLLIHYRLVPGYRGGHGLTLVGLTRHQWGNIHFWIGGFMIVLVIIHLLLNLLFIRTTIARKKPWIMTALGLLGLITVLFFLIIPVEPAAEDNGRDGRRRRGREIESEQVSLPMARTA